MHDQSGPSKKHFKKYLPKQQVENTSLALYNGKGYLKKTLCLGTSRKGVSLSRVYKSLMFIFVHFFGFNVSAFEIFWLSLCSVLSGHSVLWPPLLYSFLALP